MDGVSSVARAGIGIVIITLEGIRLEHSFRLGFRASNNKAKYKDLLAELRAILDMGAREVEIYSNSRWVVSQVQGSFEARNPRMKEYLQMVRQVMSRFLKAKVLQVAWGQNRHAGSLATLASSITEEVPQIGINKIVRSNLFLLFNLCFEYRMFFCAYFHDCLI